MNPGLIHPGCEGLFYKVHLVLRNVTVITK